MKQQCLGHRLTYGHSMPVRSLVDMIAEKAQVNTQHYGRRPYGVGLLVAGVDDRGPHLFEFQPSGMTDEMVAFAIGARSQMARTYLEKNIDAFAACDREQLVQHGLRALKESLVQDRELTVDNTSVGIVGFVPASSASGSVPGSARKVEPFRVFDGQEVKDWIDNVADDKEGGGEGGDDDDTAAASGSGGAAPAGEMEVDQ